jgi:hypothetical protein
MTHRRRRPSSHPSNLARVVVVGILWCMADHRSTRRPVTGALAVSHHDEPRTCTTALGGFKSTSNVAFFTLADSAGGSRFLVLGYGVLAFSLYKWRDSEKGS